LFDEDAANAQGVDFIWRGNGNEANKTFAFNGKEKILTVHTKVEKSELLGVLLCR
jgi:hypothetical protein